MTWFHISAGDASAAISLHGQEVCAAGACHHAGLGSTGFYGDNAAFTLWGSVAFALVAASQVALKLMRGFPSAKFTKKGYFWGVTMAGTVLTTAYLFPPEGVGPLANVAVERTWGPLVLTIAQIAGIFAVHYAADGGYDDDVGEYKPVVIAKPGIAPKPPTPTP
jgi:hypothetical protein